MTRSNLDEPRTVGFGLFLGILFLPWLFAWFTLRDGYSVRARFVALGWAAMVALVPIYAKIHSAAMTPEERFAQGQQRAQDELGVSTAAAISLAEKAVRQVLKDPDSAQFQRETARVLNPNPDAFNAVVCGFVNSKNSFGGYAGYKGFVVRDRTVYSQEEEGSGFTVKWNRECLGIPTAPAPPGFRGLKWGARPPSTLIPISAGAMVYTHRDHQTPLFMGIQATEEGYTFEKARLDGGDIDFSGPESFEQLRAALTSAYGEASDAAPSLYRWTWPKQHVQVLLSYNAKFQRTSVGFSKLPN